MSSQPHYTLPLDSQESNLATTGGKGHNLSILSRAGGIEDNDDEDRVLIVPPGFVVTTAAYHEFVNQRDGQSNSLLDEVCTALEKLGKSDGRDEVEVASNTIQIAFLKRSLPRAVEAGISNNLANLCTDSSQKHQYFAVRSSATCEDMPDASFAGQHDTYLNIPSSQISQHVIQCFSSLFTPRAISYRQRNGISHTHAGMAVVIQDMVLNQTCSGVLFTANPLTGRRNEMVLEAIPGLGEALVSGLTEPDRFVVARNKGNDVGDGSDDDYYIKDTRIGSKAKTITSVKGGGVKEEEVHIQYISTDDAASPVLTDENVHKIVRVGKHIEELFEGNPQDIEWALSLDGKISFVQSRPITTLFPLPSNVPADPLQVFFSFGAVQGVPAPFYPAGQSAIRMGLLGGMLRWITWGKFGSSGEFMQTVAERLYLNVTNPLRNSIGRTILCHAMPMIEPGSMVAFDELLESPDLSINSGMNPLFFCRAVSLASVVVPRYIFSLLFPDWSRGRIVKRVDSFVKNIEKRVTAANGLANILEVEQGVFGSFFPEIFPHLVPRMAAFMGPLVLLTRLASGIPDGKDLVLTVTRGLPHNVTTEMDLTLWQVAKTIQDDPVSLNYVKTNDADTLADDYLNGKLPTVAQNSIAHFIKEYGMRGLYEIDFGRPRWREEPAPLMNTLKGYVEIEPEHAPDKVFAKGEVAAKEAIEKLGQKLGKPRLVSFLARRIRSLAGLRELPKFTIIRIMGCLRAKRLEVGESLVDAGVFDDPKDLFLLNPDELASLASGKLDNCKRIIEERKATMERENVRPRIPRVIASDGFAYYGGTVPTTSEKEGLFCGEPVSPGVYEGRIRIIHDPSQSKLSPGDILCCHGTDPSWTPLFLTAGALLTEVGGLRFLGKYQRLEAQKIKSTKLESNSVNLLRQSLTSITASTDQVYQQNLVMVSSS